MPKEVLDFKKCVTYTRYCGKYGVCLANGQLESDLHVLESDTNKRRFKDQNNAYLQKCEEGGCQEIEAVRAAVEKLNR